MRLEILIQFIVPLTFLAIWALTSLLNRDAQPLPPRPGRPGRARAGARPHGRRVPGNRNAATAGAAAGIQPRSRPRRERITARRPSPRRRARMSTPASRAISPAPALPGSMTRSSTSRRRWSRAGANSAGAGSLGSGQASAGLDPRTALDRGAAARGRSGGRHLPRRPHRTGRAGDLPRPLGHGHPVAGLAKDEAARAHASECPAHGSLAYPVPGHRRYRTSTGSHSGDSRPTLTGVEIRKMLASPGKIREIALLSEILQPPVALRRASADRARGTPSRS